MNNKLEIKMGKKSLFFLLFLPIFSYSQIISNYGIKIGFISSKAADVKVNNYYWNLYKDSRLSGSYSIFAYFLNSEYYRFEAELGYRQEGAEDKLPATTSESPDGTGEFVIIDHAYDFLSLNLALQPKYENDNICLFGIISFSFNNMLKNRDQLILNNNVEKFLLGYSFGLGLQPKNILNGKLFFEFRFNDFLFRVVKNDYFQAKFNSVQFSIGSFL